MYDTRHEKHVPAANDVPKTVAVTTIPRSATYCCRYVAGKKSKKVRLFRSSRNQSIPRAETERHADATSVLFRSHHNLGESIFIG